MRYSRFTKIIALLLAFVMLFGNVAPVNATESQKIDIENEKREIYGDYEYVILEDGTVEICQYTNTEDFEQNVIIPSEIDGITVTRISEEAFAYNENIHTVVIPDCVIQVGNAAFHHCLNLATIAFYGQTPTFGMTVVEGCHNLERILCLEKSGIELFCAVLVNDLEEEQADSVEVLEYEDLSSLKTMVQQYIEESKENNIETVAAEGEELSDFVIEDGVLIEYTGEGGEVIIPNGVTEIGAFVFSKNTSITKIVIPESVSNIREYAFTSCIGLEEVTLPENLVNIGESAFSGCTGLSGKLTIPDMVSTIGNFAFANCRALEGVTFGESLNNIGENAFFNCEGLDGNLILPDSVVTIGKNAFNGCIGFSGKIKLSASLETIGEYVFSGCENINGTLVIPDGVIEIPEGAFYGMKGLGAIEFGVNVSTIAFGAFQDCTGVTEITFKGESIPEISFDFFDTMNELKVIFVPEAAYDAYNEALLSYITDPSIKILNIGEEYIEGSYDFIIEDGVLIDYVGAGGDVTIPDNVTIIGTGVFSGSSPVNKITIPSSVKIIQDEAFYGSVGLNEIAFSEGLESIGNNAFYNCDNLTGNLVLPDSVISIGDYAFAQCENLNGTLKLSDSLQSIGEGAFEFCENLVGDLIIPDSVISIGTRAFSQCDGFQGTLTLSNNLVKIGAQSFEGCCNFTGGLTIPNTVIEIGEYAFGNCGSINGKLVIGDGIAELPDGVFSSMSKLASVVMGSNVTTIGEGVFCQCTEVLEFCFTNEAVPVFADNPFEDITNLNVLYVPAITGNEYYESIKRYLSTKTKVIDTEGVLINEFVFDGDILIDYKGEGGEVIVPEGTKTIGDPGFQNNENITKIVLPTSVQRINAQAFEGCENISEVVFTGTVPPEFVDNMFLYMDNLTKICVPQSASYDYYSQIINLLPENVIVQTEDGMLVSDFQIENGKLIAYWGDEEEIIIPNDAESIGEDAFRENETLKKVTFSETLKSIENGAFYNCKNVKMLIFNGTMIPSIPDRAFNYMENLEYVIVPKESYESYISLFEKILLKSEVLTVTDILNAPVKNLQTEKIYSKTIALSWKPHISDQIIGYRIERDGQIVGTTTECMFEEKNLVPGTTYTYHVYGYTDDEKTTAKAEIIVTPNNPQILDMVTEHPENKMCNEKNKVYIYVSKDELSLFADDETEVKLFCKNGDEKILIGEPILNRLKETSECLVYQADCEISHVIEGEYQVVFEITDIDHVTTEYEENVFIDHSVPVKILGMLAVSDIKGISLNWGISSELETSTYRIYRKADGEEEFSLLKQINNRDVLTYYDKDVEENINYFYYVVGVDSLEREGELSDIVTAALIADAEKPVVTQIVPVNGSVVSGDQVIRLTAKDNVGIVKSELYYSIDEGNNWILLRDSTDANFSTTVNTCDFPEGKLLVKGIAYDAANNSSAALVHTYHVDNVGPEQVQGLAAETTSVTITLHWNDVKDEDIHYFCVEQRNTDGQYGVVTNIYNTLGANIYNLKPDTEYTYRVVGYDRQGNRGVESEDITVITQSDTTSPVITNLNPTASYYADEIQVSATTKDDYNISYFSLQVSQDGAVWNDICTENYTDISKVRTLDYTLKLDEFKEGNLFFRAYAEDSAKNQSDLTNKAPFIQYIVDRTSPMKPDGVKAESHDGYIEVSWNMGTEKDLSKYSIYRSNEENGTYELLRSNIEALNYFDRSVERGKVYYYKVVVTDIAGNESEYSDSMSAEAILDTINPEILSVFPKSEIVGADYKTIGILATDNHELNEILIEYSKDNQLFEVLHKETEIDSYYITAETELLLEEFEDGELVYIRATATDKAGNKGESVFAQYKVDKSAPVIEDVTAEYSDGKISIHWTGQQEKDLIGYRIYRACGSAESYNLLTQINAIGGRTEYSFIDNNLSELKTAYIYNIVAVDEVGNTYCAKTQAIESPGLSVDAEKYLPKPVISCDSVVEVGVEYVFDGSFSEDNSKIVKYQFDFGDGTVSSEKKAVHKYTEIGEYLVKLFVTDDDGNQTKCERKVVVKERTLLGEAQIKVVDENGVPVANASVYFDLGEENEVVKRTNSSGYVGFTTDVGKHSVGCIIADNKWLPVKKDIIVVSGEKTEVTMTMVHQTMIEGQFEIKRMTFEEIVAAGIDISDPENQYIVRVNVELTYEKEKIDTSFIYDIKSKTLKGKAVVVDGRELIPVIWDDGSGGHDGNPSADNEEYEFSKEITIAFLDVPIGVSALKDFFDVKLHIINNASEEFSMRDNRIELNVPQGVSIVETYATEKNSVVHIEEVKGQTTETVTWILRGDEIGEYYLSADYSGILSQFNEVICAKFEATEPIKVYGLSNLKMRVEIPDELDHGTFYYNVMLINEGREPVYRPNIETEDTLLETQLFDERGTSIVIGDTVDALTISKTDLATNINGVLDVLESGHCIAKHYMSVDQTEYTEQVLKLKEHTYDAQNTYGLEIEFVEKPVRYFKSNLNGKINAIEKAELTFEKNQSAYDYLITNENYIYWNMFASTGDVKSALTTESQERLWELLKIAGGTGSFESLFGQDDDELIEEIILDTMEISVESDDYLKYKSVCDWTNAIAEWAEEEEYGEWPETIAKWVKKTAEDATEEKLKSMVEAYGKSLKRTYQVIGVDYKYESYIAVFEGQYLDWDNMVVTTWKKIIKEEYSELDLICEETKLSELNRQLYTGKSFEKVWKALGFGLDVAEALVSACENAAADVTIYLAALSNYESYNLFLDTLIENVPSNTEDGKRVISAAKSIKDAMEKLDYVGNLTKEILDKSFWLAVDYSTKEAIKQVMMGVPKLKAALMIGTAVGDNVFHVSERHDIADNIRFVSYISDGLVKGINSARENYSNDKTEQHAMEYMQLIAYLVEVRRIGESQVAQFGVSYEVVPNSFDSKELFLTIKNMSGADDAQTWYEWRDFVEDKISLIKAELLKNPLMVDMESFKAPIVSFDYVKAETVQSFSNQYEYSLDSGKTWTVCQGTAISVKPQFYTRELQVRHVDSSQTNEKRTASIMIYGIPLPSDDSAQVIRTEKGYRIDNLNNHKKYEVTFSKEQRKYGYEDSLDIEIPRGSYTYELVTDKEYAYVYIRSVADSSQFSSSVYSLPLYQLNEVTVRIEGKGAASGAGKYEYGSEALLMATQSGYHKFEGWYQDNNLVSVDETFLTKVYNSMNLLAKFVLDTEKIDWVQHINLEVPKYVKIGETVIAKATPYSEDNKNSFTVTPELRFESSNSSVAEINAQTGKITGKKAGKVTITVYADETLRKEAGLENIVYAKEVIEVGHVHYRDSSIKRIKNPTCTATGIEREMCSCGEMRDTSIKALGHNYKTNVTKATTSKNGTITKKCSRCSKQSKSTIYKISTVNLSATSYTYNGSSKKPSVTVKNSQGTALKNGRDYTVSYASGRKKIGKYKVVVSFKGNYSGSKNLYFTIGPKNPSSIKVKLYGHDDVKVSWNKVSGASGYKIYYKKSNASSYTYLKTTTSTSYKKSGLADGVKYYFKIVAYKTVDGEKCYNAGKTNSIYTLKKVTKVKSAKSGSKVKISWSNIAGESGYQISKSTSKSKTGTITTYTTTEGKSKKISASKGKTYYYKVRAYKTVDGKKIYGPWSDVVKYKR